MSRERLLSSLRRLIKDERVLEALASVPRDAFVPPSVRDQAWDDVALPIASGQTISQPRVVGRMCELLALNGSERVLDVGGGSGYHAAVLSRLARRVWSIERHEELASVAAATLRDLGYDNVDVLVGDGSHGLPEQAPFDAINVAAASGAAALERLAAQLAEGGRLVAPLRERRERIVRVVRSGDGLQRSRHEAVRFVPLVEDP